MRRQAYVAVSLDRRGGACGADGVDEAITEARGLLDSTCGSSCGAAFRRRARAVSDVLESYADGRLAAARCATHPSRRHEPW